MELAPLSDKNNWTFRRVVWVTLVFVLILLGFWLLYRFYHALFILFIAILIATVIRPIVNWLYQKGLPRITGVILVYLLLLALSIGFVLLIIPMIIMQGSEIVSEIPLYYQNLREWLENSRNLILISFGEVLPASLPGLIPDSQTGQEVRASLDQAWSYVSSAAEFIFLLIAVMLLAYHWALDGERNIRSLLLLIPKDARESVVELISAMEEKIGYFIAGQGVLCLVIGIMSLIAYLLIGLPNALVLALTAGLLEAVPMIGPLLGAIPAAIIALSISPTMFVWVVVSTLVIQQLENNFLVPRVMRKAVGVNPFVSILAIFAFSSLFGIPGALMAIPMAAIIQLLLDHFVFRSAAVEPEDSAGRDHTSRLRYETQSLATALRGAARIKKGGSDHQILQIDKVMDEIEALSTDLDVLLSQVSPKGTE
jgi:predicted PurR-regulated permease PerM